MQHQPSKSNKDIVTEFVNILILNSKEHWDVDGHFNIFKEKAKIHLTQALQAKDAEREKAVEAERERMIENVFELMGKLNIDASRHDLKIALTPTKSDKQ